MFDGRETLGGLVVGQIAQQVDGAPSQGGTPQQAMAQSKAIE